MPLYPCGEPGCVECAREFGQQQAAAITAKALLQAHSGRQNTTSTGPTAEDWENACHAIVWKADPGLFERIQEQAQRECDERMAAARSKIVASA